MNNEPILNGVRWEEIQRSRERAYGFKRGQEVVVLADGKDDDGRAGKLRKRAKIMEFYKNFVLLIIPEKFDDKLCLNYHDFHKYVIK